jgi:hypothetical protein
MITDILALGCILLAIAGWLLLIIVVLGWSQ